MGRAQKSNSEIIQQLPRAFFHLVSGTIAVGLFVFLFDRKSSIIAVSILTFILVGFELSRFVFPKLNSVLMSIFSKLIRPREKSELSGQMFYALGLFWAFVFLPKVLAVQSILILAWMDPVAGIVGSKWGRVEWVRVFEKFWNQGLTEIEIKIVGKKTLEGSFAGFFVALGAGFVSWNILGANLLDPVGGTGILAGWSAASVGWLFSGVGAFVAMLAEAWPSQWDDNANVPFWVGAILWVLALLLGVPLTWGGV
jgi:dolichol kinase